MTVVDDKIEHALREVREHIVAIVRAEQHRDRLTGLAGPVCISVGSQCRGFCERQLTESPALRPQR